MAAVSVCDVARVDRGVHRDPQLVAAELAVGLGVDDAVGAQRLGDRGGVDRLVEVDGADHQRAVRPGPRRTASCTPSSRPSRRARRRTRWCARPCRRARPGRSSSRAARPSGTAWRPTGCCRSGSSRSCRSRSAGRRTPGCSGRSPAISSARASAARRHQRDPQAAVGGEALLRREVVGVDLGEVDGQAAGAGRGVDEHERVVVGDRGWTGAITAVEVSLWAHA